MKNILFLIHHFDEKGILRDSHEGIISMHEDARDDQIDDFIKTIMNEYHFNNKNDTFFWKEISDEEITSYREENPEVPVMIIRSNS